jgi:hypothetical protein
LSLLPKTTTTTKKKPLGSEGLIGVKTPPVQRSVG